MGGASAARVSLRVALRGDRRFRAASAGEERNFGDGSRFIQLAVHFVTVLIGSYRGFADTALFAQRACRDFHPRIRMHLRRADDEFFHIGIEAFVFEGRRIYRIEELCELAQLDESCANVFPARLYPFRTSARFNPLSRA